MATYEEVSNTLSELESKVLNHYNVAKVRECSPKLLTSALSIVFQQVLMFRFLKLQAIEIQKAAEAYLLRDGSQWSCTPPVKVSHSFIFLGSSYLWILY